MTIMRRIIFFSVGCFFLCPAVGALPASPDIHLAYGELLARYVKNGEVDYSGLKKEEGKLAGYLAVLAKTDPAGLEAADQLALYINAYNACTISLILDNFKDDRPVKSIKDIGGLFTKPWSIRFCEIGGTVHTLDEIEHEIIRPVFQDPRVHFAVNCAAKSCPLLLSVPYDGGRLDQQLNENAIAFVNDTAMNYLAGKTLFASRIFSWFSKDFHDDTAGFFRRYAKGALLEGLQGGSEIKVKYLSYDWSLNGH